MKGVYLLYSFADNLLVLLLGDFLLLVKRFDGCLHFIYSFLLNLLFLQQEDDIRRLEKKRTEKQYTPLKNSGVTGTQVGQVTFSFLELSA